MSKIKVVVTGASGRMGKEIIKKVLSDKKLKLIGAIENNNHPTIGKDVGLIIKKKKVGLRITDSILESFAMADAVIDFTTPKATVEHAKYAAQARLAHVIGTTGFNKNQLLKIKYAAQHATIIKSGNMSLGVNLVEALTKIASSKLDEAFFINVNETHHKHKVDAPSGTALMLGNAAALGKKKNFDKLKKVTPINKRGKETKNKIVFSSFRKGEVIGDHEITFMSQNETIKISHKAMNRGIFVDGAIQAVKWGHNQEPGLYSMSDVLGLN